MWSGLFKNKKILIIGGTGSIGSHILSSLLSFSPKTIRVFSRDEYKQYKLRNKYADQMNIEYYLGDVRDSESVLIASKDCDIIFHCAALKHVPPSEEMPEEFIKTNILGSLNVKKSAVANKVPVTVSISSDKAVDPGNLMGLTKAVQEKIFSSHLLKEKTPGVKFVNVRFGNVIGTHGSLFPTIYYQYLKKKPITVTDFEMTRFFMSQKEAIDLIFWATINGKDGDVVVKKMKSAKMKNILRNFFEVLNTKKPYPIKNIGIRVGEKMHEYLITEDNVYRTREKDQYFIVSPYHTADIEKNIILKRKSSVADRNQFFSNYPKNFMSDNEIKKYIKLYIKEARETDSIL